MCVAEMVVYGRFWSTCGKGLEMDILPFFFLMHAGCLMDLDGLDPSFLLLPLLDDLSCLSSAFVPLMDR